MRKSKQKSNNISKELQEALNCDADKRKRLQQYCIKKVSYCIKQQPTFLKVLFSFILYLHYSINT